jgi:hypothetical protein
VSNVGPSELCRQSIVATFFLKIFKDKIKNIYPPYLFFSVVKDLKWIEKFKTLFAISDHSIYYVFVQISLK